MVLGPPPPRLESARIAAPSEGGSPAKLATDSAAARGSAINEAFDVFREERNFYPHRSSKNCYRSSEARFATFSMLN